MLAAGACRSGRLLGGPRAWTGDLLFPIVADEFSQCLIVLDGGRPAHNKAGSGSPPDSAGIGSPVSVFG